MMKGVMVLGLLLPEAVLREQLIKTTAGRLSITAGAPAEREWLESGADACRPVDVFTKAPGLLMLVWRAKKALDCTTLSYITHTD